MKYLNIIFILIVCNYSFAQDPRLYENNWYLTNLVINGSSLIFPNNTEASNIILSFSQEPNLPSSMKTTLCNEMWGNTTFGNNLSTFSFSNYVTTLSFCTFNENAEYQSKYLSFFTENEPNNSFDYIISETDNVKTLTIISSNNKQAIYSSQMLSTNKHPKLDFSISPNPVSDFISIKLDNQNFENALVQIYNSAGTLCKTANIVASQQNIKLENLPSGIYLLKLKTTNGSISKKFIKK